MPGRRTQNPKAAILSNDVRNLAGEMVGLIVGIGFWSILLTVQVYEAEGTSCERLPDF